METWEDIALAGALAEEMAEEERERLKVEMEMEEMQEKDEGDNRNLKQRNDQEV